MEKRIDIAMAERGVCKSRSRAKRLLKDGLVLHNGSICTKPSQMVGDNDTLTLIGEDIPYVGKGGLKLREALHRFPVTVEGRICMDVGASTGGFTDCMLQHGAKKVYAIDVGKKQLDDKLRQDARVVCLEERDVRLMAPADFSEIPDFCSVDVSFISLTLILPAVYALLAEHSECVALIKPQFEAGREQIGKRGIVKSESAHKSVIENVTAFARSIGFSVQGLCVSPIRGGEGKGNTEYLVYLVKGSNQAEPQLDLVKMIREAEINGG
ncbi:MAG: TlyA family RNA methyltransferase [Ruminococcus sp.]|nr:TlyA family RNA methyltransferase [Ruminococcus sp.]